MYLRQAWNDPRLQFDGQQDTRYRLNIWDRIWVPDTFFRYDLGSFVHEQTVPNRFLTLSTNGDIWYVMK